MQENVDLSTPPFLPWLTVDTVLAVHVLTVTSSTAAAAAAYLPFFWMLLAALWPCLCVHEVSCHEECCRTDAAQHSITKGQQVWQDVVVRELVDVYV